MAENTGSIASTDSLSSLLEDTVTSLRKDVICEKAVKIQKAIVTCLEIFLNKVAEVEPLFRVSELIQVSSYAEGTKILQPDEFDFLAVLGELSEPGAIVVNNDLADESSGQSLQAGYVTVGLASDTLNSKWKKHCDKGLLQCLQNVHNSVRFGNIFIKAIVKMVRENVSARPKDNTIYCSSTEIEFVNCMLGMPTVDGVSMKLIKVEFRTPNVFITFKLDYQEISVDLSPAIRYYRIEDCFKANECASMVLSKEILSRKSLLLIGNRDFYFKVTVTESEVWYIQTIMKHEHRVIYMVLKYIIGLFKENDGDWILFSSYMLKNLCIMHGINCEKEKVTTWSCFVTVIESLSEYCLKFYLPSVINKNINLFAKSISFSKEELEYRENVIEALQNMCRHSRDIHSVDEFQEYLHHHIKQIADQFRALIDGKFRNIKPRNTQLSF